MRARVPDSPSDRLTTPAPLATAQSMPAAMASSEPDPSAPRTRTGMIRAPGAVPATPMPLPVTAAAMPATWVP